MKINNSGYEALEGSSEGPKTSTKPRFRVFKQGKQSPSNATLADNVVQDDMLQARIAQGQRAAEKEGLSAMIADTPSYGTCKA